MSQFKKDLEKIIYQALTESKILEKYELQVNKIDSRFSPVPTTYTVVQIDNEHSTVPVTSLIIT